MAQSECVAGRACPSPVARTWMAVSQIAATYTARSNDILSEDSLYTIILIKFIHNQASAPDI